jgi:hypothetical protein
MAHALRRTVGPFAAGTRVWINNDNNDGTCNISVEVPEPIDRTSTYSRDDMVFDIEKSELVELRSRSDEVPQVSRQKRRAFLGKLFNTNRGDSGVATPTATTTDNSGVV